MREALTILALALAAVTLAGLVVSRRWRRYPALTFMLGLTVLDATVMAPLKNRNTTLPFESLLFVADLLVFTELARRVASHRPRSRVLGRFIQALVALNLMAAAAAPSSYETPFHEIMVMIRADLVLTLGFAALAVLAVWHRLPVTPLETALVAGMPLMRVGHGLALWLWLARDGAANPAIDYLFAVLWVGVYAVVAWRAWVPLREPALHGAAA